jgi:hypothetical protein
MQDHNPARFIASKAVATNWHGLVLYRRKQNVGVKFQKAASCLNWAARRFCFAAM